MMARKGPPQRPAVRIIHTKCYIDVSSESVIRNAIYYYDTHIRTDM